MDLSRYIDFKNRFVLWKNIFCLTLIGIFLGWIGSLIQKVSLPVYLDFVKKFPVEVVVVTFFIYLIAVFITIPIIINFFCELLLRFMKRTYIFKNDDWCSQWIFSGHPELRSEGELFVKQTRAGCLLKSYAWQNFKMSFELMFLDYRKFDQTIGLVFRAENLDNYFMLELSRKHKQIKPHIRYHGGWNIVDYNLEGYDYPDQKYFNVELEVKDELAYLRIEGNLIFIWILPTHVDVNYKEAGVEANMEIEEKSDNINKGRKVSEHVKEISFRKGFGMIGFRAHPGQGALIKGLSICDI